MSHSRRLSEARAPLSQHSPGWEELAAELGVDPAAPLVVALSGGSDSVYLLDWLRSSSAGPALLAVHVNHGLRGAESLADEAFCRGLCEAWRVPCEVRRVELDGAASNLEQRARQARYLALGQVALAHRIERVATAHQGSDVIETMLMRWMRGSAPAGMLGPRRRSPFPLTSGTLKRLELLRPLLDLDGQQMRRELRAAGIEWREDSSNQSPRFTRNRVRHGLLPLLREHCGPGVLADLHHFQRALARHEEHLARSPFEFDWQACRRAARDAFVCPRASIEDVAPPLLERALYRSLIQRSGRAPRRHVTAELAQALAAGQTQRWNLRAAWGLELGSRCLWLLAPPAPERRDAR